MRPRSIETDHCLSLYVDATVEPHLKRRVARRALSHPDPEADGFADQLQHCAEPVRTTQVPIPAGRDRRLAGQCSAPGERLDAGGGQGYSHFGCICFAKKRAVVK
jgi:hypothetical protein